MKNYWLDRWTDPIIDQAKTLHSDTGKWYVTRQVRAEVEAYELPWDDEWDGWQIASGNSPDTYFLHSDGTWYRNSTLKNGKWTGYYDTREEAEAAITAIQDVCL